MNIEMETSLTNGTLKARDNDGLHKRRGIWHYKRRIGGRWREFSTRTSSDQEARKIRQQAIQDEQNGRLPTDMGRGPFEKAASDWLATRNKLVASQTLRIDRERLVPLLKAFGGRRLEEITNEGGSAIRTYQMVRVVSVGNRTVNLETKVLRMILRRARLWSRVADDYKSLPENKQGPGRALSAEEEKKLFAIAALMFDCF